MSDSHERALRALERRGRLRALSKRVGIDFSSNDYLGLGGSKELREAIAAAIARGVPAGAGGSRLLRGNDPEHEALEAEAAGFFGAESALYFGGGFVANYTLFATLPERGDLIVHDELIHASVHDGMRASRAGREAARHNDAQSFEDAVKRWRAAGGIGRPWIAAESLYSMDGDRAPLDDLMAVAERHDGMLVVDEAHATGVHGPGGRGLGAHLEGRSNLISLHTCGKALGVMGALVLAPKVICDFLVNRGRPFIYATAPSPLIAAGVRAALDLCRRSADRRTELTRRIELYRKARLDHCGTAASGSQIDPVIVGSDARATAYAAAMQAAGFDIRAVRPPTVPEGAARLRISITLNVSESDIDRMVRTLADEFDRLPA
jgi:8-amino-7-oxononanoate synthase